MSKSGAGKIGYFIYRGSFQILKLVWEPVFKEIITSTLDFFLDSFTELLLLIVYRIVEYAITPPIVRPVIRLPACLLVSGSSFAIHANVIWRSPVCDAEAALKTGAGVLGFGSAIYG